MINSCPLKTSKEWKELVFQTDERTAWGTWMYFNGDYPPTFMTKEEFKSKLLISPSMSGSNILSLKDRLRLYNEDNGTSHSILTQKTRGSDQYTVNLNMSYYPIDLEITRKDHSESLGLTGDLVSGNTDHIVSKYEFKTASGKLFSTKLYDNQLIDLHKTISALNNSNFENGISEVYSTKNKRQIGESNQYTIDIVKSYKSLNIDDKIVRSIEKDFDKNTSSIRTDELIRLKEKTKSKEVKNSKTLLSKKVILYPVFNKLSALLDNLIIIKSGKDFSMISDEYKDLESFYFTDKLYINSDKIHMDSPLYLYAGNLYLNNLKENNLSDYNKLLLECSSHPLASQINSLYNDLNTEEKNRLLFNLLLKLVNTNQISSNILPLEDIESGVRLELTKVFLNSKLIEEGKELSITLNNSLSQILKQLSNNELFSNQSSLFGNENQYTQEQIKQSLNDTISDKEFEKQLIENGSIQTICKI
jgi:hypothetical protein